MSNMSTTRLIAIIAVAATLAPAAVFGGTLGKIGNAIAYPVKKAAANTSIDTHRAIGHNSVERRRVARHVHRNRVITPGGHIRRPQPQPG